MLRQSFVYCNYFSPVAQCITLSQACRSMTFANGCLLCYHVAIGDVPACYVLF